MSLITALGRPVRAGLVAVLLVGLALPLTVAPVSAAGLFGGGDQSSQDSRDTAQLTLRIQTLEQQVRDLTGQVQGLQFQLTQVQTLIDRMNQDNDFRFKQLEGGKGGAPAAGQSGDATPQVPAATTRPARVGAAAAAAATADTDTASADTSNAGGDDGLGGSMDPLVGKGRAGAAPSTDEVPLAPSTGQGVAVNPGARQQPAGAAPVTQEASTAPAASQNPAAMAQYKSGYDAIVKGNYTAAADQFKAFIKQYPTDPQVPDATNWLGEALLQQQDYVDAAEVLVTGYKSYPTSPRAPDMLLKLGIALAGTQHVDAACKTFGLLSSKYPNTTTAFRTRLKQEMARDQCPA